MFEKACLSQVSLLVKLLKLLNLCPIFDLFMPFLGPQGVPKLKSDVDDCRTRPCQNGGICYNLYRRYVCKCPYGFTGPQCQTKSMFN